MRNPILTGVALLCASAAQAATLYVNPVSGNDTNSGTQAAPLKNIGRALQLAVDPTNAIFLAAGTYSISTGERFNWGVVGRTYFIGPENRGAIIDAADGPSYLLQLAQNGLAEFSGVTLRNADVLLTNGGMLVRNATLEDFHGSLPSEASLRLQDVDVRGSSGFDVQNQSILAFERVDVDGEGSSVATFIRAIGGAVVTANELSIYDMVVDGYVIDILQGATLDLRSSSIVDSWGTAGERSFVEDAVTIRVKGKDAIAWIFESSLSGSPGIALFGDRDSMIKIEAGGFFTGNRIGVFSMGASFLNNSVARRATALFRNSLANWRIEGPDATALIYGADFRGGTFGVQSFDNARFAVLDSTFKEVSRPISIESADAGIDFGTVGQNLQFLGSASNYVSVVAKCSGSQPVRFSVIDSTWRPGVQGADSNGHYGAQTVRGVQKGGNYWLKSASCYMSVD